MFNQRQSHYVAQSVLLANKDLLVGASRCNGMIPHDHDIDLAIYSKETFDKLLFLFQEKLPKKIQFTPLDI
jgi:phosphorylcholine metabolism protein LicD